MQILISLARDLVNAVHPTGRLSSRLRGRQDGAEHLSGGVLIQAKNALKVRPRRFEEAHAVLLCLGKVCSCGRTTPLLQGSTLMSAMMEVRENAWSIPGRLKCWVYR